MHYPSIAAAYDSLAERWLDERFASANGVRQHKHALSFIKDGVGGWALNVGCGCNTRFNAMMRDRDLQIEGIDISERMIALAGTADPSVHLHHADVCRWQPQRTYRFITAWDSIWHVPLEEQRPLMLKFMAALEAGGVFIFSAGGTDVADEHIDASMGPELYYSTLGIPGLLDVIKEATSVCRHLEFDQYPQGHLYVVVQRPA